MARTYLGEFKSKTSDPTIVVIAHDRDVLEEAFGVENEKQPYPWTNMKQIRASRTFRGS